MQWKFPRHICILANNGDEGLGTWLLILLQAFRGAWNWDATTCKSSSFYNLIFCTCRKEHSGSISRPIVYVCNQLVIKYKYQKASVIGVQLLECVNPQVCGQGTRLRLAYQWTYLKRSKYTGWQLETFLFRTCSGLSGLRRSQQWSQGV